MFNWLTIKIGKLAWRLTRLRGGGSALPGLIMEKINPLFVKNALDQLKYGTVVVSGTNGKTSTTKILVKLLEDQGLTVFTNKTGSNFWRGVASSLLQKCNAKGQISADIAVLELDEAHGVHFAKQIKPNYSLLLNVMRDQLDRFGEIDTVAKMLAEIAANTQKKVILNREDSHLMSFGSDLGEKAVFFGYSDQIKQKFKTLDNKIMTSQPPAKVELHKNNGSNSKFIINNQPYEIKLKLTGIYNHFNSAGAILATQEILGDKLQLDTLLKSLAEIEPAFGRGEKFKLNGTEIELILVKNPSGFQMSLNSLANQQAAIMIAINDNYADGRDVSWLWDVDFTSLPPQIFATTGSRSKDMLNRLKYDQISAKQSNSDISKTLDDFIKLPTTSKQIYSTYTAMLQIRQQLVKLTKGNNHGRFN